MTSDQDNITVQDCPERTVTRVRHPLKFRLLRVQRVRQITPTLVRVTLAGDDLHDFVSASFDDHVKVFFPLPGMDKPLLPTVGPDGVVFLEHHPRSPARDYTPRRYDRQAGELDLEFALHDAGPASAWARQAQPGQWLGVGGPRGSLIIPTGFDWHWLIGDDTALPAIARRLEELPADTRVVTVIEVADAASRIDLKTRAQLHAVWRYRDCAGPGGGALLRAVQDTDLPCGDGYVWVAAEAGIARAVRQYLVEERGVPKSRIRAASYWRRGSAAVHEAIDG
ncbi:siderophore-interacting protein (plasmid) [Mycetohabitans endofungorum]|uniref:siderophore-interacting protein n=1 Tax=Mycetohabitans endofungorum TaxID=417203 RepID=UPI0030CBD811